MFLEMRRIVRYTNCPITNSNSINIFEELFITTPISK